MRSLIRQHLKVKNQVVLSLLFTVVLEAGCGGSSLLKSFRIALASSAPLVNSLVASGAIPQSKATAIIADFDAGAECGQDLQSAFSAAQTRSDKWAASVKGLACFRAIVQRQNFAANPRIQTAANIAEGILNTLVIFYSDSSDTADGPRRAPVSEKTLEARLESQVEALKEAMKP